MKRLLLASSALVAFSGAAAADTANFELSGVAEMGLFGTSTIGNAQFFTDIDVTFTMSGETDNGLTFGAVIDIDEAAGGATGNNQDDGGAYAFISGAFGTVTMGDTDGALDWALTEAGNVGNPGSLADDETSHAGYLGAYGDGQADGQIMRWDYTTGAFGVAVSLEDDNGSSAANTGIGYAIGLKYNLAITGGTVTFGIGHQKAHNNTAATGYNNFLNGAAGLPAGTEAKITGVSVSGAFDNGLSAGITYTDHEFENGGATIGIDHVGVGLGYTTGAISVHANWGKYSPDAGTGLPDSAGFGVAAAYDLGGGAVIKAGWSKDNITGAPFDIKRGSIGLALSF